MSTLEGQDWKVLGLCIGLEMGAEGIWWLHAGSTNF